MTNNTKADALTHIETQIELTDALISANKTLIKTYAANLMGLSAKALAEDITELRLSVARHEGRLAGLHFAREEILALGIR